MKICTDPQIEGYFPQKANCTVVALSVVTGIPYNRCYEIAKQFGRKDGRGFNSKTLITKFNKQFGRTFDLHKRSSITVQKFCKMFPTGSFYVRKKGHAFAIVDGVCVDKAKIATPMARITDAWKLTKSLVVV